MCITHIYIYNTHAYIILFVYDYSRYIALTHIYVKGLHVKWAQVKFVIHH